MSGITNCVWLKSDFVVLDIQTVVYMKIAKVSTDVIHRFCNFCRGKIVWNALNVRWMWFFCEENVWSWMHWHQARTCEFCFYCCVTYVQLIAVNDCELVGDGFDFPT